MTKLNADGTALIYSTFIGYGKWAVDIEVDPSGAAYLTCKQGVWDIEAVYVAKLNSSGTALIYSLELSGSGWDEPRDMAVDSYGAAYVVGYTRSPDFPVTVGAYQTTFGSGYYHAFVVKISSIGTLIYSTFLRGSIGEVAQAVAVDSAGAVYVGGYTVSSDFPTTLGAFDSVFGGGTCNVTPPICHDGFFAKLDPTGSVLLYSTFIGGSGWDEVSKGGIAVDSTGVVYLAGSTASPEFPTTLGAFGRCYNGGSDTTHPSGDVFVIKLNPSDSELLYSTFIGGNGGDVPYSLVLDLDGAVYIAGNTSSYNFPVTPNAFKTLYDSRFLVKLVLRSSDT